MTQAELVLRS